MVCATVSSMEADQFEVLVREELNKVPERFRDRIKNVEFLIEDEPSETLRQEQKLEPGETLLGLYHGVPNTVRGVEYGVGVTLPDTITLFRNPILHEAGSNPERVRTVIKETVWHEIGHYFGFSEHAVSEREKGGTNTYRQPWSSM